MAPGETDGSRASDIESIFADWLDRAGAGEGEPFAELCARHQDLAEELQGFHGRLQKVASLMGATVADVVRTAPSPGEGEGGKGPFEEFLARLARHAPTEPRYEERDEIARGGMGAIREVFDVDLRRALAKKVILEKHAGEEGSPASSTLGRFLEEAQVTAQLDHPGVVPVHELGMDEQGQVFFTMALVGGRDLHAVYPLARAEREGWTTTRVVDVLLRVCETVAYAHAKSVIHRDLKPGNVMVGEFGQVYVMDWGLAKVLDRPASEGADDNDLARAVQTERREESDRDPASPVRTQLGSVTGTPHFMSPEQARGEVDALDARTDVYAIGAMLYSLLAGHSPYADTVKTGAGIDVVKAIWKGPPTALATVARGASLELVAIAEKAMAREAGDRYAGTLQMAEDLRAYLDGRVVRAYESGAWAELRKWVGRNKALAGSLAAGFLAVLGGVTGMFLIEAQGRRQVIAEQERTNRRSAPLVLSGLLAEDEELWPALPSLTGRMERWLQRMAELRAEEASQAEWLAVNAPDAGRQPSAEPPSNASDAAWEVELVAGHLEDLRSLQEVVDAMEARLALATSLEEVSLTGAEARTRWEEAIAAIATSPEYGGLEVAPQFGLVPLRADPESGLWEFWHVPSGERPNPDPETGAWRVEPRTGIVLVLLPGGPFRVGPTTLSEESPLFDPWIYELQSENERQNFDIAVDPFFISKYELTQAQWYHVRRSNPSKYTASPIHPVESVSWIDCEETMRRLDLVLPTEAQWEYACRGGMDTRYYTGQNMNSLVGHANLRYTWNAEGDEIPWQDDHENHAPVGSYLPNPYGLYDVHGNVWEWCRDYYDRYGAPRDGDGLRTPDPDDLAGVFKGGSFGGTPYDARVTRRYDWYRKNSEPDTGLRPARPLVND